MSLRLSISGARGIVGESLTPDVMLPLIEAFSQFIPEGFVITGMDGRPSGRPIGYFVGGVLCLLGRNIVSIGTVPTPTIALCTKLFGAAGGLAITASHNPEQWNALKFIGPDGMFLPPGFWQLFEKGQLTNENWVDHSNVGGASRREECSEKHIQRILSLPFVDSDTIRSEDFRVAYDGVGGAGPAVMIPMLRELGVHIIPIGHAMNGQFIHEPEPIPMNLKMLSELVKEHGADIGIATDPDADRLAIVDENGIPLGEEFTLALAAEHVISQKKGDAVVNLSTSTLIDWIADRHGVKVHRTPVGEYWVSKKMLECEAIMGGEGNGGVIIPDMHPVRDAATAAAIVFSMMSQRKKKISQIAAEFPEKAMLKEKFPFDGEFAPLADKILSEFAPDNVDNIDGVWFRIEDGFIHVRPSNTEPVVRVIVETGDEKRAREIMGRAKKAIQ